MSINRATVLLGDAQAIKTGRIANRIIGRAVSRLLRSVWR